MEQDITSQDPEQRLLRDIGGLSTRLRELRASSAMRNAAEIKTLEGQSRDKWTELRSLRAGPAEFDMSRPRSRGLYQ